MTPTRSPFGVITEAANPPIPLPPLTVPIAEFLGDEAEADTPDEWLVAGHLPPGVPAFIAGLPKAGKTWIAILYGICVATGEKLFGRYRCRQGAVVIVTEEDTVKQIRRRLWWLARGLGVDPRQLPIRVSAMKGFRIDDPEQLARLEGEATGAALVILDALTRIHALDENSRTDMQVVTLALSGLAARTGATILTIHHMRKKSPQSGDSERPGQRMRGTGDLHALARAVIAAEKRDDGSTLLSAESNYSEDMEPYTVKLKIEPAPAEVMPPGQKRRAWFEFMGQAEDTDTSAVDEKMFALFNAAQLPLTVNDVRKLWQHKEGDVNQALPRLARNEVISLMSFKKLRQDGKYQSAEGWVLKSREAEIAATISADEEARAEREAVAENTSKAAKAKTRAKQPEQTAFKPRNGAT